MPLRAWQRRALTKYLTEKPRDFLAVATPGAGKTAFGLRIAPEVQEAVITVGVSTAGLIGVVFPDKK